MFALAESALVRPLPESAPRPLVPQEEPMAEITAGMPETPPAGVSHRLGAVESTTERVGARS
jgi:hypothetical protein